MSEYLLYGFSELYKPMLLFRVFLHNSGYVLFYTWYLFSHHIAGTGSVLRL
jgi:hypothetical protein